MSRGALSTKTAGFAKRHSSWKHSGARPASARGRRIADTAISRTATSAATNPTSLKFPDDPDRMCLQCHAKFANNISAHTHHPASAEASRCVACHMPRIMNSVLFQARTHQIDDIPNAEMTARFGAGGKPERLPALSLGQKTRGGSS